MGELIEPRRNRRMLHGQGGMTLPKPFERDIFLFDTYIAGTSHIDGME